MSVSNVHDSENKSNCAGIDGGSLGWADGEEINMEVGTSAAAKCNNSQLKSDPKLSRGAMAANWQDGRKVD